jgi:hypothetical protein
VPRVRTKRPRCSSVRNHLTQRGPAAAGIATEAAHADFGQLAVMSHGRRGSVAAVFQTYDRNRSLAAKNHGVPFQPCFFASLTQSR